MEWKFIWNPYLFIRFDKTYCNFCCDWSDFIDPTFLLVEFDNFEFVHGAEAIFSAMLTFDILAAIFMFSKTYTINILAQCWNAEIFDNIVTIWHSTNKKILKLKVFNATHLKYA